MTKAEKLVNHMEAVLVGTIVGRFTIASVEYNNFPSQDAEFMTISCYNKRGERQEFEFRLIK